MPTLHVPPEAEAAVLAAAAKVAPENIGAILTVVLPDLSVVHVPADPVPATSPPPA